MDRDEKHVYGTDIYEFIKFADDPSKNPDLVN